MLGQGCFGVLNCLISPFAALLESSVPPMCLSRCLGSLGSFRSLGGVHGFGPCDGDFTGCGDRSDADGGVHVLRLCDSSPILVTCVSSGFEANGLLGRDGVHGQVCLFRWAVWNDVSVAGVVDMSRWVKRIAFQLWQGLHLTGVY